MSKGMPGHRKTVAPLYFADTYGEAIRKPLRKVYQKLLRQFTPRTRMALPYVDTPSRGVTRDRIKRGVAFQTTGMRSIPEHHVNRGIGL